MILVAAGSSDVGLRRRENQDHYVVVPDLGLYAVADGMGGHSAGRVASRLAVDGLIDALERRVDSAERLNERLRAAVHDANSVVFRASQERPGCAGMGTTLVAFLSDGRRAALAHVGDSRAYLVREGRIRQLTDDHSIVGELLRRNQISENDAREHPHRHVLTRALGVRDQVEPDLAEFGPAPGDVFVLCSDGLTTHVEDHDIAKIVSSDPDLQEAAESLVDLANGRGGEDNTTVLLIRFGP